MAKIEDITDLRMAEMVDIFTQAPPPAPFSTPH
jgi:hypothetical protein